MNARSFVTLCAVLAFVAQSAAFDTAAAAERRSVARAFGASSASQSHLYVTLCASASDCIDGSINRYPLTNGIPAKTPDLVYPSDNGPIAIGPNGDLYANYPGISGGLQAAVDVFAAGTNTLLRRLILPGGSFFTAEVALAVDANGYLYASWYNYPARLGLMHSDQSSNGALLVYAPGAKNSDPPINSLAGNFDGLAIDAHGALYAVRQAPDGQEVDVFATPETSLVPSRSFSSRWIQQPQGAALDGSGVLHILDTNTKGEDYVSSFNAGGTGQVRPLGIFRSVERRATYSGICVAGGILYLPNNSALTLTGYPIAPHGGHQIFTLALPHGPQFVAVGP